LPINQLSAVSPEPADNIRDDSVGMLNGDEMGKVRIDNNLFIAGELVKDFQDVVFWKDMVQRGMKHQNRGFDFRDWAGKGSIG